MELNQFINSVDNEITLDGALPLSIPKKTIVRIIKEAKKWFYVHYEPSLEEGYFYIHVNDSTFVCDNYIQLPPNIKAIYGTHSVRNSFLNYSDFTFQRIAMEDYYKSQPGVNSVDFYAVKNLQLDMVKYLFQKRMSFDYNVLTNKLFIRGWRPNDGGIICDAFFTIPDNNLYQDGYFFRYVVAKSKIAVARLMGTITMPLVGGASIDFSLIKDEGEQEIEKIIEEIDKISGVDYIMKGW